MAEPQIHAGDHLGEYLLLERLSRDPLAEAWRARHSTGSRVVTLRVPCDDRVAERFAAFTDEPKLSKGGHLLRTLRKAEAAGTPVVIQEFAEGTRLQELISRNGPLPAGRAKHLLIQILQGLSELHRHGVPHGNLRPDRVIVTRWDAVKLADVGTGLICGRLATERLRDSARNGRPGNGLFAFVAYQSPEQRRGEEITPAGDVYAAGLLAYEMLTGRPYGGELTAAELAEMPDWAAESLPACLDRVEIRYPTAIEALGALDALPHWAGRQRRRGREHEDGRSASSLKQRGKLKARQRRSVRKMVAWITILAAVLVPGALLVTWLWLIQTSEPVTPLRADSRAGVGGSASAWRSVKGDCMWRWADALRAAGGRDVVPGREQRFLLVRLHVPADARGQGLTLRGDGSQASLTDSEGTLHACTGTRDAAGYRRLESARSAAVQPPADGWIELVFQLPPSAGGLRLRVRGFGGVWDTALDTSL